MGKPLPFCSLDQFEERLACYFDLYLADRDPNLSNPSLVNLETSLLERLHLHYEELSRWNSRLSLIGPGTLDLAVERHYGESLLGASLLEPTDERLLDLGSGAGFPGLVLAAAQPSLNVVLAESRAKKCAFLRQVARVGSLSCRCLNARVEVPLPAELPKGINVISSRAVRIEQRLLKAFFEAYSGVRCLLWQGSEPLELPNWARVRRSIPIPESQRRILEVVDAS